MTADGLPPGIVHGQRLLVMTSLLGVAGSIVGGLVSSAIWKSPDGRFHPAGWFLSIIGALLVLWIYVKFIAT